MDTVKRVFEILEYILKTPDGVLASEIAREFNMSISNAYKYLSTLESLGILIKRKDKRYTGGFKLVEYGSIILRSVDLRQVAHPYLIKLLMDTGQTVHMVVKDGFEGVYVEKLESASSLPMISRVGMRAPLYCTAFGKSILSHMPADELERYFRNVKLERRTEHTVTDPELLKRELEKVRKNGYAVDNEENELGVKCIGAPILNHEGYPVAAISISGVARKLDERMEEYARLVKSCAEKISETLGYKRRR